ncbi:cyclophilin B [Pelomyxa schiedti]|nr:cyclophilin B [Pelomyxa schiedti]
MSSPTPPTNTPPSTSTPTPTANPTTPTPTPTPSPTPTPIATPPSPLHQRPISTTGAGGPTARHSHLYHGVPLPPTPPGSSSSSSSPLGGGSAESCTRDAAHPPQPTAPSSPLVASPLASPDGATAARSPSPSPSSPFTPSQTQTQSQACGANVVDMCASPRFIRGGTYSATNIPQPTTGGTSAPASDRDRTTSIGACGGCTSTGCSRGSGGASAMGATTAQQNTLVPLPTLLDEIRDLEQSLISLTNKRETLLRELKEIDLEENKQRALVFSKKEDLRRIASFQQPNFSSPLFGGLLGSMSHYFDLTNTLPMMKVIKHPSATVVYSAMSNNAQDQDVSFHDVLCGRTISTYPMDTVKNERMGDPVCDKFHIRLCIGGKAFLSLADGCNWGHRPKEAALRASLSFVGYLYDNTATLSTIREYGALMLQALAEAHNGIVIDKKDKWEAGTTTLLGLTLVPVTCSSSLEYEEWACIILNIGDCKAFKWSNREKKITELTTGNRSSLDACDPGGRIGPYTDTGSPDLRNLSFFFTVCQKDDVIFCMSDGVHDNLEALSLAVEPQTLCPTEFAGITTWEEAMRVNPRLARSTHDNFMTEKLTQIVLDGQSEPGELDVVVRRITDYCTKVTAPSRSFMEENPQRKLPCDYKNFPGKLDHTTCIALRVKPSWLP